MIEFARPDGGKTKGYLATAGQGRPGVVVIQEWWGLNDQICGVADRFARAGYNALAPDLYKGRAHHPAGRGQSPDDRPRFRRRHAPGSARRRAAPAGAERKGGGDGLLHGRSLTIAAAVHVPEFAAGVCFYGIPPKAFADPAKIRIPLQGHFANKDDWCTPAAVDDLERTLKAAGVRTRSTVMTRPTPSPTSAARLTTSPAPTRHGSAWRHSWGRN